MAKIKNKFMIGEIVEVLVDKNGGRYEPHSSIRKGQKTCITEIHAKGATSLKYICDDYNGFEFNEDELKKSK